MHCEIYVPQLFFSVLNSSELSGGCLLQKDEKATELKDIPISLHSEVDYFGWGGRRKMREVGCNCHLFRIC